MPIVTNTIVLLIDSYHIPRLMVYFVFTTYVISAAEETLLEENLSCSNLELCDSTFTDEEEDASEYDEEHALSDEEKKCHTIHADRVDECAKKSPDPQTKVIVALQ